MSKFSYLLVILIACTAIPVTAQMERQRVAQTGPVEETFWSPNLVGMSTVESLDSETMNVTIMHNFGPVNEQPLHNFFGLDFGSTVRLGLDYGITDRWSLGIGRTSPYKLYDFRSKYALLRQDQQNEMPLSLSVKGDLGINTNKNGYSFSDRLNMMGAVLIARKFSDQFSLQLSPTFTHFNRVFADQVKNHLALGIGGEYRLSDRWAVMAEYFPILGNRSADTQNAFAVGVNIETGGHVFQLFLKSSNWHTEQHIIALNTEDFWAGDIRFGFNVNRIFWFGEQE